jgi:hypothetical protein
MQSVTVPGFGSLCLEATSRFRCCKSKAKLIGTIPGRYRLERCQLRYFAAVTRADLTRVAEMLDNAQPPLSRQIAFLVRLAVGPVSR